MTLITAIIITFSIVFGSPSAAPAQAPTAPTQAVCEEDMACWDSASMGNGQADTLKVDAWDTLDHSNIHAPEDSPNLMLSYTETVTGKPANLPTGYFSLESHTIPNAFHVFKWDLLQDA